MLITLALLALQVGGQASQAPVERAFDLRLLDSIVEYDATIPDPRLALHASRIGSLTPDVGFLRWPTVGRTHVGDWLDVLNEFLTEEESEQIEWSKVIGSELFVQAKPEVLATFDEMLGSLERHAVRDVEVSVRLLDLSALDRAPTGWLSAEDSAALLSEGLVRGSHVLHGRLGRPVTIDATSSQPFLYSYNATVRQATAVVDPVVSSVQEGLAGGVLAEEHANGELEVRAWFHWSELQRPMELLRVGVDGELAHMLDATVQMAVGSANLRRGESMLLAGTNARLAVLVSAHAPELSPGTGETLRTIDISAAIDVPHLCPPYRAIDPSSEGGWKYISTDDFAWDDLEAPVRLDRLERQIDVSCTAPHLVVGKQLFVRASEEEFARYEPLVKNLLPAPPKTYAIELRGGFVAAEALAGYEDSPTHELARALPEHTTGTTNDGGSFVLVGGRQRMYVASYDTLTNFGMHMSEPEMGDVFDGLAVWVRVFPATNGVVQLQHEVRWNEVLDYGTPLSKTQPDSEFPGMSFPRVASWDAWSDRAVQLGEWTHLKTNHLARGPQVLLARVVEVRR